MPRSILISLLILVSPANATSQDVQGDTQLVALAESMQASAELSTQRGLPIVIFVSQHGCEYCQLLRRNVLYPMIRSGDVEESMLLREVSLDAGFSLIGFDGVKRSGSEFAQLYGVTITPTLLFLDARGLEVAERRVGTGNIDFYSFYLDRALAAAAAKIAAKP